MQSSRNEFDEIRGAQIRFWKRAFSLNPKGITKSDLAPNLGKIPETIVHDRSLRNRPGMNRKSKLWPRAQPFRTLVGAVENLSNLICFENEHLLVVNKPPRMNIHSPSPYAGEGLYDWL